MSNENEVNTEVQNTKDPYKSDAVLEQMKTLYTAARTDDERGEAVNLLVTQLGKSKASVIGKLGALKIYQAKKRTTKQGGKIVRKWELAAEVNKLMGDVLTDAEEDSITKATKDTLIKIIRALNPTVQGDPAE